MNLPTNTTFKSSEIVKLACYEAVTEALSKNNMNEKEKVLIAAKELYNWVIEE